MEKRGEIERALRGKIYMTWQFICQEFVIKNNVKEMNNHKQERESDL